MEKQDKHSMTLDRASFQSIYQFVPYQIYQFDIIVKVYAQHLMNHKVRVHSQAKLRSSCKLPSLRIKTEGSLSFEFHQRCAFESLSFYLSLQRQVVRLFHIVQRLLESN